MNEGKIQVFVRSRRTPAGLMQVSRPLMSGTGVLLGWASSRSTVFESKLDDEHQKAVNEGRRLALQLGLKLEVVDESGVPLLRRVFSYLAGLALSPKVVITPSYGPTFQSACASGLAGAK